LLIGDVGGNDYSTAKEEVDLGVAGAKLWLAQQRGDLRGAVHSPLYFYPHNGAMPPLPAVCLSRHAVPSTYQGSYFFADYTQIGSAGFTFDANGAVNGVFNFEPADGSLDGPYGDIVYLTEGPDGALYYVDLGYSDISGTFGVSKIRRIRYIQATGAAGV